MMKTCRQTIVLLAALSCGACSMAGSSNDRPSPQPPRTAAASPATEPMKTEALSPEARLLGFLNLANKGDLEGGRLAQERGASMAVKTYGRQMETDHLRMLEDSERAAQRVGVLPTMGPESQPLVQEHTKAIERLQAASGKEFDRLYLAHEIEMHKQVLETGLSLAGQTQNPQLKEIMASARPILEAHLKAAQMLMNEQR